VTHTYDWTGTGNRTFKVVLTVTDDKGASSTTTPKEVEIREEQENSPPEAKFTMSPTTGVKDQSVYFDASESKDTDGEIVKYEWNFGDGSPLRYGEQVSHIFTWSYSATQVVFTITLTVTDDKGATHSLPKTLTVNQ